MRFQKGNRAAVGNRGTPGNQHAAKHGAWSIRVLSPVAERHVAQIIEATPALAEPHFRPAVEALAIAAARVELIAAWVETLPDDGGVLDYRGRRVPPIEVLTRAEATAGRLRTALGLTPMGRHELLEAERREQRQSARIRHAFERQQ